MGSCIFLAFRFLWDLSSTLAKYSFLIHFQEMHMTEQCANFFQEENLSSMNTDPWYSAYHYSHPPLVERLAAIDESDKKAD